MTGKYKSSETDLKNIIKKLELENAALKAENQKLKKFAIVAQNDRVENVSLKKIISFMPGSIYWKDTEGRYLGCNNYIVRMCHLSSPDDIIGKRLRDFFDPAIANIVEKNDSDVIAYNKVMEYEETGFNEKNEPAVFLTKKTPLRDDEGRTIGLLGISFDISDRKKIEEDLRIAKENAEAYSKAKSQFLAIMNHELRTPLASILGLHSILKRKKLSAKDQQTALDNIKNCTHYLLSLIDDVLDFSRLDAGKYSLYHSPVNVHNLAHEVHAMLKPLADNKGIELKIEFSHSTPCLILTDPRVLRQILINLITNALKFTEKGHVIVQIETYTLSQNEVRLNISVTDTGKGIPKNKLDVIFEPFEQLDNAYTRQSSRNGTGLGLAIVKKLAALINADISVKSKVKVGSTFSISAILQTTDAKANSIKTKSTVKKIKDKNTLQSLTLNTSPTVMLIEDDPIVQYVHKKMLTNLGCKVEVATHGIEAINKLNNQDIVFVDISLPDISGFDVIKAIRRRNKTRKIPIVALTAYNGMEEKAACLSAGANAFKNKPISQTTLKKLLIRYLTK